MTRRVVWLPCTEVVAGLHAPMVTTRLKFGDKTTSKIKFVVDSGASLSMVPRHLISDLFRLEDFPAENESGLLDASGKALKGVFMDFDVVIEGASRLPETHERFLVCRNIRWSLLGMTWFEKLGVHFRNFPHVPQGRRFALYPSGAPGSGM